MTFTIKQVVDPSEAEIEAISKAFAAAFADDEFFAVVLARDPSLVYDLCKIQVVAAKLAGEIYIAESGNQIIGSALWFGPGRVMFDSDDQNEQALIPFVSKLPPGLQHWWSTVFISQYDELVANALGPEIKKKSFHLQLIGIIPEQRRMGIAKALINEVRKKAAGVLLCLEAETEMNIGIYEKLGFQVKGDNTIFRNEYGSFPMWVLATETSES